MFYLYGENTGNLPTNENHLVFKFDRDDCHILFSVSQQGKAASCHFSSDHEGLRHLKEAINEWCDFCFYMFDWCEMILAKVNIDSIERLLLKLNFIKIASCDDVKAYVRAL
jgi:hypothetical protein